MGRIILEEQAAPSTPAVNKIALYPKSGGGVYKKNDAGTEKQLVEAGADSLITSMTGLDNDGIPLAKVANAGDVTAAANITANTVVVGDGGAKGVKGAAAGDVAHGFIMSLVQAGDIGLATNDTIALTFAFVPSKIVIDYNLVTSHDTSYEKGFTSGHCLVTITGTDAMTHVLHSLNFHDSNSILDTNWDISETTNLIRGYGGVDASDAALVVATGVWVTATKTLTLTFTITNSYSIYNAIGIMAIGYA